MYAYNVNRAYLMSWTKLTKNIYIQIEITWIVLEVAGGWSGTHATFPPVLCCHTCIHHAADDDWIPQTYAGLKAVCSSCFGIFHNGWQKPEKNTNRLHLRYLSDLFRHLLSFLIPLPCNVFETRMYQETRCFHVMQRRLPWPVEWVMSWGYVFFLGDNSYYLEVQPPFFGDWLSLDWPLTSVQ